MIIHINDRPCEAQVGDRLLSAGWQSKSHIGYICGGSGICQSCFVNVLEGMEYLSEPNAHERTFISERLLNEGGRLACQTVIVKEGPIKVLARAEKLRRTVLSLNLPGFIDYAAIVGYNFATRVLPGGAYLLGKVNDGKINPIDSLGKIRFVFAPLSALVINTAAENAVALLGAVGTAAQTATGVIKAIPGPIAEGAAGIAREAGGLVSKTVMGAFDTVSGVVQGGAAMAGDTFSSVVSFASNILCTISGGMLHLPGSTCQTHDIAKPGVERVTISAIKA